MEQRRKFWEINLTVHIFNYALIAATALFLIIFYAICKIIVELQHSLVWQIYLIILQIALTGFFVILLIVIFLVLHRVLGPIPRMEKILEKVINGDRSLRITIREKDIIHPFVDKLNKLLDLLEQKEKS